MPKLADLANKLKLHHDKRELENKIETLKEEMPNQFEHFKTYIDAMLYEAGPKGLKDMSEAELLEMYEKICTEDGLQTLLGDSRESLHNVIGLESKNLKVEAVISQTLSICKELILEFKKNYEDAHPNQVDSRP